MVPDCSEWFQIVLEPLWNQPLAGHSRACWCLCENMQKKGENASRAARGEDKRVRSSPVRSQVREGGQERGCRCLSSSLTACGDPMSEQVLQKAAQRLSLRILSMPLRWSRPVLSPTCFRKMALTLRRLVSRQGLALCCFPGMSRKLVLGWMTQPNNFKDNSVLQSKVTQKNERLFLVYLLAYFQCMFRTLRSNLLLT